MTGPPELQCRDTHNLSATRDDSQLPPPCREQQPGPAAALPAEALPAAALPAAALPGEPGAQEHHWKTACQVHIMTDQGYAEQCNMA